MTKLEAKLFFPENDFDDIEEKYEEKLFEIKQFLISHLPTTKLFNSKLKQFSVLSSAFEAIGGKEVEFVIPIQNKFEYGDDIEQTVVLFYQKENKIKLKLNSSQSFEEVAYYAHQLIDNLSVYARCWKHKDELNSTSVKMSDIPDSVELLKTIDIFKKNENLTFQDLFSLEGDNLLVKESIRLSLWLKFEKNVRSI